MMKASKKLIIAASLGTCIAIAALSVYLVLDRVVPTMLSANLTGMFSEFTGRKASIGSSALDLFPVAAVRLTDVKIGEPARPLVEASAVKVRFSLWHALFGRARLSSIELKQPVIHLDYDAIKRLKLKKESGTIPTIRISDGAVRLPGRSARTVIDYVNGHITAGKTSLTGTILGGKARLEVVREDGWKGSLVSKNIDLSRLIDGTKGLVQANLTFRETDTQIEAGLRLNAAGFSLPWSEGVIDKISLSIDAGGNDKAFSLRSISLTSPIVEVSGSGLISDTAKKTGAAVRLDLSSSTFAYEKVLDFVPTRDFDQWLRLLLTKQIRGGATRFASARYEGTIDELIHLTRFIDHIHVVQDLMGQSFGADFGAERITDITGQVVYSRGDIEVRNLKGTMGNSTVEKVTLRFPGVILPGMKVGVGVKLDMDAADFLSTWKAAGMPQYVYDLFSDLSSVQAGRVGGEADFLYDGTTERPVLMQGSVTLAGCSYRWGSTRVTDHDAVLTAEGFGSPLKASSSLTVEDWRVRSLDLVLDDPFGAQRSSFSAVLDGFLSTGEFRLGKDTVIKLKGTGVGPDISADTDIRTESLFLFGKTYRLKGKPLQASGRLTARLSQGQSASFAGAVAGVSSGKLSITGKMEGRKGSVRLNGLLDLGRFETVKDGKQEDLAGKVRGNVLIDWAESVSVEGSLHLRQAGLPVRGSPVRVDGPVRISKGALFSDALVVTLDGMKVAVSDGSLRLAGEKPEFKGNLTVEGMSLPFKQGAGEGSGEDLSSYIAQARVRMVDLDLYGIPVEEAWADARLEDGVLNLTGINAQGKAVSAQGTVSMDRAGILAYDTEFDLKGVDIPRFLSAISSEQDLIRGKMDLKGHLKGVRDSTDGTVTLTAKEGRLKRYALVSRVFALLNFYKIVRSLDLELTSKNFPYNVISSTFTIKDSILSFNDFYLDSNSLQFSAVGNYSLKTKEISAVLGVQPFETIDRAISVIPVIGWVLTGDKRRFLVISMNVKGNIEDPSVMIAPVETLSNPVKSSILRTLRLPAELWKMSRGLFSGSKVQQTSGKEERLQPLDEGP